MNMRGGKRCETSVVKGVRQVSSHRESSHSSKSEMIR